MKILQINKFYPPHVGGVETVTQQIAEGLQEQEYTVHVLTANHELDVRTREAQKNGVKVIRAGSFGSLLNATLAPSFPKLYNREVKWADLVHFHCPSPTPEFAHKVLGVPADTGVVLTFHADPGTSRWKWLNWIYAPVLRCLLRRADRIAVTAPANRDRSELLCGFKQKTDIIPLATEFGVDPPSRKERKSYKKKIVGSETEKVILFVGRLSYYKGIEYLLEAMVDIDARLVVVGGGNLRGNLYDKTKRLCIDEKVQFEGFVEDESLSGYYRAADVFVLPSIAPIEAFGIVQLDAMAHGVPVVNTSLPTGVPFVSQHQKTGLTVSPKDADALASALRRLVEDEEYRVELGRRAIRRAKKFTKTKMINRYINIYKYIMQ